MKLSCRLPLWLGEWCPIEICSNRKPRGRFQRLQGKEVCYVCKHTDCDKDRGAPRPTCWTHLGPSRITGPSAPRRGRARRVLLTAGLARENDGLANRPSMVKLMADLEIRERTSISLPEDGVAVIFGANGGIGRALTHQLQSTAEFTHIAAFSRRSAPPVDLVDEGSIASAAQYVSDLGHVRLVIDATGFLHDSSQGPEKSWHEIEPGKLARAFSLNAIGPALMLKHLLPLFPRSGKAVFATLSARIGSIGDNKIGGWYSYRASKAALNQLVRTAAIELKRQRPEAICVALHPGTVDTPLSAPFRRIGLEVQSPAVAAKRLLAVIGRLEPHDSGGFFDHKGKPVPW